MCYNNAYGTKMKALCIAVEGTKPRSNAMRLVIMRVSLATGRRSRL